MTSSGFVQSRLWHIFLCQAAQEVWVNVTQQVKGANWDHRKSRVGDQKFLGDEWVREEKDGRGAKKELE